MGRRLVTLIAADPEVHLVCATEAAGSDAIGADAGELAGALTLGVKVAGQLSGEIDCVIDFSFHEAAPATAARAAELGAALVCGTTGLTDDEAAAIESASEKVPVVFAPNMSVGVNLLFDLVGKVAATLGDGYSLGLARIGRFAEKPGNGS